MGTSICPSAVALAGTATEHKVATTTAQIALNMTSLQQEDAAGREALHLQTSENTLKSYGEQRYLTEMKIYFGFTVAGERSGLEAARRIVHLLEKMGHEVLTRHLVDDDAWAADRRISARDVYQRDMAWLAQCDIFIAEVSGSSFGLGFEAGYVLGSTQKKVILLYRRDLEERLSLLIRGNSHPNCTLLPYASAEEVDQFMPGILNAG